MKHYLFRVKDANVEQALVELEGLLRDIYEVEDEDGIQIGGYCEREIGNQFVHVELVAVTDGIDWEKQWAAFAPDFQDGFARIALANGKTLLLKPGGGFGDLSHPTTRLMLDMMAEHVKESTVFDIGCGSGILSVAATLMDAKDVYGIDIDEEAIEHSRENATLNGVDLKFGKEIDPEWLRGECVILMNMIESEQRQAWNACGVLHKRRALVITSGVLAEQKEDYLKLAKSWGWALKEEKEEAGWLGFIFMQGGL